MVYDEDEDDYEGKHKKLEGTTLELKDRAKEQPTWCTALPSNHHHHHHHYHHHHHHQPTITIIIKITIITITNSCRKSSSLPIITLHHESSPSGRQFLFTCCCEFQPLIVRISLGRSGWGGAYWAFQALLLIWQALSSRGREVHGRLSRSWFLSIMITLMVMKIVITIIIIIVIIIIIMIIMMKCSQLEGGPWLAIGELVALYTRLTCDPGPWPLIVKCWRRKIHFNSCKPRPVNQGGGIYI